MVNDQANILSKELIIKVSMSVMKVLGENKGNYFSSSEVFYNLDKNIQSQIRNISVSYPTGPLSSPASFVGSILSCAAKEGVLKKDKKICSILKKQLDCFGI